MNRILCFCALILAAGLGAQAPDWLWGASGGGTDREEARAIVCDAQGNTYVTGTFQGAVQFGNTYFDTGTDTDIFVAKLDPQGNWLWAKRAGNDEYNDSGEDIAIDAAGNLYLAGWFNQVATFDNLGVVTQGGIGAYVAKLSPAGQWLWVNQANGSHPVHGYCVTTSENGHAVVAGCFVEEDFFGSHSVTCDYGDKIWVAETDADGNWIWAETGGSQDWTEAPLDLATDSVGNSYLTGYFQMQALFGTTTLTSGGPYSSFVAKLSDGGDWLWAVQAVSLELNEGHGMACDAQGNAFVTGVFTETALFGAHSLEAPGSYQDEIYLAKLSPSGDWLWAIQGGGSHDDWGWDVDVASDGTCFVTGSVVGTVAFGPHQLLSYATQDQVFVAKADADGNWLWATRAHGGFAVGYGVDADQSGNSYVCGSFDYFNYFGSDTIEALGDLDVFVAKLAASGTDADDNLLPGPGSTFLSGPWPNPLNCGSTATLKARLADGETGSLSLFNQRGQKIWSRPLAPGETELSIGSNNLKPGLYLCHLKTGRSSEVKKLVIVP